MALSDNEVTAELKKMVAFIKQEALEKAREIHIKADEEFAIEKSKLVRQETASIDAAYERKFKQAELSQQIVRSTVTNKTRLKILAAQQDLLDQIFEAARQRLSGVSSDTEKYQDVIKNLVFEGLYCLNEASVKVKVREEDYDIVRKAIPKVEAAYKEALGKEVKVEIDENDPLPSESAGGAIIVGFHGKIDVNNTLEERLRLMEFESLPAVRTTLFGPSPNRKFYD
ncbi:vacuolar ATP synthase subunit E [Kalaharituber pfeilii]|nr:vacuolar ATP synthase subunit E [Kalaharituber pfeilii]